MLSSLWWHLIQITHMFYGTCIWRFLVPLATFRKSSGLRQKLVLSKILHSTVPFSSALCRRRTDGSPPVTQKADKLINKYLKSIRFRVQDFGFGPAIVSPLRGIRLHRHTRRRRRRQCPIPLASTRTRTERCGNSYWNVHLSLFCRSVRRCLDRSKPGANGCCQRQPAEITSTFRNPDTDTKRTNEAPSAFLLAAKVEKPIHFSRQLT